MSEQLPQQPNGISLSMTPQALGNRLTGLEGHIHAANEWAANKFRLFPNLSAISVDIGAALIVQFSVTLTWQRNHQYNPSCQSQITDMP